MCVCKLGICVNANLLFSLSMCMRLMAYAFLLFAITHALLCCFVRFCAIIGLVLCVSVCSSVRFCVLFDLVLCVSVCSLCGCVWFCAWFVRLCLCYFCTKIHSFQQKKSSKYVKQIMFIDSRIFPLSYPMSPICC